MKLRGASQLGHQRGRDLFNFAYTHTVRTCFSALGYLQGLTMVI